MTDWESLLERAWTELAASEVLVAAGFGAQAVSRAYFGAFYAAEAALLVLGETRSKHSGVVAAFIMLVVRDGGLDEDVGRRLRSLFESRNEADDASEAVPDEEARRAIEDARTFVDAVSEWCRNRA